MLKDQKDLLSALNSTNARYLVVGGHAVGLHSEPRSTKDIDIFIGVSAANAPRVFQALARFGAPLHGMTAADFSDGKGFQIGLPPERVDILQVIDGVEFDEAWERRVMSQVDGLTVPFISLDDLIANKLASGRLQDLADVEKLRKMKTL